jgi:hypothetical protein
VAAVAAVAAVAIVAAVIDLPLTPPAFPSSICAQHACVESEKTVSSEAVFLCLIHTQIGSWHA